MTPDKDADTFGGTVDFKLADAAVLGRKSHSDVDVVVAVVGSELTDKKTVSD